MTPRRVDVPSPSPIDVPARDIELPSRSPIDALVHLGVTQPIARPVAADDAHFLASKGRAKIVQRVVRGRLELALSGQRHYERARVDPSWKRALWVHAAAPQIGDALMDLAPRSLLIERGIEVDLLAPPVIAALFTDDRGFAHVYADEARLDTTAYDFVIVDSRSGPALAAKRRRLPDLPWVSIKGDYLGYDYQRGLLATRRLAELLGIALDDAAEQAHSRQKLWLDAALGSAAATFAAGALESHPEAVSTAPRRVALALGGVRAERTYTHWNEVAARLLASGDFNFTLLGSANAKAAAADIKRQLPAGTWLDLVDRTDLHGTWAAMREASVVLCADGGLMHLAFATATPVVALFDASVDPAWRLPLGFDGEALRANGRDVNRLDAQSVAACALAVLGRAACADPADPTTLSAAS